jgi:GxxExxY protein
MHSGTELLFSEITHRVIGAAMQVHSTLGNRFQEVIYQRALSIELEQHGVGHEREYEMPVYYRDRQVGSRRVDFLIEGKIAVELKAITVLEPVHLAQAKNYLEAYNLQTGLLINFGAKSLEFRRLRNDKYRPV